MAKFRSAWHIKTGRLFETDDVSDFIVQTGHIPILGCPDESCRNEKPGLRITPVCCDPNKPDCAFIPHFRTHQGHQHSENCLYRIMGESSDYILRNRNEFLDEFPDANILKKITGIDSEFLPDVFVENYAPHDFTEDVSRKAKMYLKKGGSRMSAWCRARCATPYQTSKLSLIVDMAIKLDQAGKLMKDGDEDGDKLRMSVPLHIPGRKTNYLQAFLMVASLCNHYATPYILCGEVIFHKAKNGYLAEYINPIKEYCSNIHNIPAYTPISPDFFRSSFMDEVKAYEKSGEQCALYSFSTHDLNESTCPIGDKKRCVVIKPRFREAVVIRKRCVKRSSQKNIR